MLIGYNYKRSFMFFKRLFSQNGGKEKTMKKIGRALISVSDKTGIVELAKKLHGWDIQILSTGGYG